MKVDRRSENIERKLEGVEAELIAAGERAVRSVVALEGQVSKLSQDAVGLNGRLKLARQRNEETAAALEKERQSTAEFRGAALAAQRVIKQLSDRGIRPEVRSKAEKGKSAPGSP